jgi:amino acid transporter
LKSELEKSLSMGGQQSAPFGFPTNIRTSKAIRCISASRTMWAMSCAGVLPKALCVLGKKRRTPWVTILVVGLVTNLFAVIENIETVAELVNSATARFCGGSCQSY